MDYFPSKLWPLHIQRMRHFLVQQDQLLLVLGDHGTGKSSLLKQFYDLGNLPGNCLELTGKATLQPQKLAKLLCKKWHLNITLDQNFRQHQLDDILVSMKKFHQPGLLIIDDSHQLPIATLAAIMHLCLSQSPHELALRIILLGEPNLAKTMNNLHSPDVTIPAITLQPLTLPETTHFIEHMLDQLGIGKTRALKEQQIEALFQQAGGIAKKTRHLVIEHLRHQTTNNHFTILPWVQHHWVKLLCLGMLGLAFTGMHQYQQHINALNHLVLEQATPPIKLAQHTQLQQPIHTAMKTATDASKLATKPTKPVAKAKINKLPHTIPSSIIKHTAAKPTAKPNIKAKFVIQVMGDYNKARVIAKQKSLPIATDIRQSKNQDKDWFTLTTGQFSGYSQAKQALTKLPLPIQKLHPWIKPLDNDARKKPASTQLAQTPPQTNTNQVW